MFILLIYKIIFSNTIIQDYLLLGKDREKPLLAAPQEVGLQSIVGSSGDRVQVYEYCHGRSNVSYRMQSMQLCLCDTSILYVLSTLLHSA